MLKQSNNYTDDVIIPAYSNVQLGRLENQLVYKTKLKYLRIFLKYNFSGDIFVANWPPIFANNRQYNGPKVGKSDKNMNKKLFSYP